MLYVLSNKRQNPDVETAVHDVWWEGSHRADIHTIDIKFVLTNVTYLLLLICIRSRFCVIAFCHWHFECAQNLDVPTNRYSISYVTFIEKDL